MHIQDLENVAFGTPLSGGFYAGQFQVGDELYALIVSPKQEGELEEAKWGEMGEVISEAKSCFDGLTNTRAMAESGSDLARWMMALEINGQSDWYLPSRDELEICYRNLKPTDQENFCTFRDGDNPSSSPVGYPYSSDSPAKTLSGGFQNGGEEAFAPRLYWASTQYSSYYAWGQGFDGGRQDCIDKANELRARAVRRVLIK